MNSYTNILIIQVLIPMIKMETIFKSYVKTFESAGIGLLKTDF